MARAPKGMFFRVPVISAPPRLHCRCNLLSLDKLHYLACLEVRPTLHLLPVAQSSSLALPCQILVSLPASIRSAPSGQVPTGHTLIFSASRGRWHGFAVTDEVAPRQLPSNPSTQASRGNCICPGGLRCNPKHTKSAPRQRRGAGSRGSTPGNKRGD